MRLLLHVGLNKCASTYIQECLAASAPAMAARGVLYRPDRGRDCHYGLSRHYGFGPDAGNVTPHAFSAYARLARLRGNRAMILSSEYLSLNRPAAIGRLIDDINAAGWGPPRVLFFARPFEPWLRSLFNQYVRTVDGPRYLPSIDAYVDQVMANRAVDIAARYRAWEGAIGPDNITLIDIAEKSPAATVLRPFSEFCGFELQDRSSGRSANRSTPPGVLFMMGLIRRAPPSPARTRLIETLHHLDPALAAMIPAPPGYLTIGPERRARLAAEIEAPFAALPRPYQPGPRDLAKSAA